MGWFDTVTSWTPWAKSSGTTDTSAPVYTAQQQSTLDVASVAKRGAGDPVCEWNQAQEINQCGAYSTLEIKSFTGTPIAVDLYDTNHDGVINTHDSNVEYNTGLDITTIKDESIDGFTKVSRVEFPGNGYVIPQPPAPTPVNPPVNPPVQPPVNPPVQPPVNPPVQPPVNPPVQPPVNPPVQPPVNPPVQPPVNPPVQPPVNPPVQPPVNPPVEPPVNPPVDTPTNPPVDTPTEPPVTPQPPVATPTDAPFDASIVLLVSQAATLAAASIFGALAIRANNLNAKAPNGQGNSAVKPWAIAGGASLALAAGVAGTWVWYDVTHKPKFTHPDAPVASSGKRDLQSQDTETPVNALSNNEYDLYTLGSQALANGASGFVSGLIKGSTTEFAKDTSYETAVKVGTVLASAGLAYATGGVSLAALAVASSALQYGSQYFLSKENQAVATPIILGASAIASTLSGGVTGLTNWVAYTAGSVTGSYVGTKAAQHAKGTTAPQAEVDLEKGEAQTQPAQKTQSWSEYLSEKASNASKSAWGILGY